MLNARGCGRKWHIESMTYPLKEDEVWALMLRAFREAPGGWLWHTDTSVPRARCGQGETGGRPEGEECVGRALAKGSHYLQEVLCREVGVVGTGWEVSRRGGCVTASDARLASVRRAGCSTYALNTAPRAQECGFKWESGLNGAEATQTAINCASHAGLSGGSHIT